jgi:ribosomal protein S12 methylthiotransferase accessory factor
MLHKPVFKAHIHVEPLATYGIVLFAEHFTRMLKGTAYRKVAPLVNGSNTSSDIVRHLHRQVPATTVYYILMEWENHGYLTEASPPAELSTAAFWHTCNTDPHLATSRLQQSQVSLLTCGAEVPTEPFIAQLEQAGITLNEDPQQSKLTIVLTTDYLHPGLAAINQQALQTGLPWMLVKPVGTVVWIGPLFLPDQTACWSCLAHRLRQNRPLANWLHQSGQTDAPHTLIPAAHLPISSHLACTLAALETLRWIASNQQSVLAETVLTLDLTSYTLNNHHLVRRPQCSDCGDPTVHPPQPLKLQSRTRSFPCASNQRTTSPRTMIESYSHHISPISGIVQHLDCPTIIQDAPLHTCIARYAAPPDLQGRVLTLQDNVSSGKGSSEIQARASVLGEAIERVCGHFHGDEYVIQSSYHALGEAAIHPNACMLISEQQYAHQQTTSLRPFDEHAVCAWSPVWSLTQQTFRYLPAACCYFNYPFPQETVWCRANSNGNAAGMTVEEAILHGIFELIERDALAIWWYNQVQRPAVNLDSFHDPYIQQLRSWYCAHTYEFWVLDITTDLPIPTFVAILCSTNEATEHLILGAGCHSDPHIALLRAITEMNQLATPFLTNKQADCTRLKQSRHTQTLHWLTQATRANQPYLLPNPRTTPRNRQDYNEEWSYDILEDLQQAQQAIEQQGMEVLVLAQTRPDIGMPVVKVIIPGLRPHLPRFAAGRLYDVPVALEWRKKPLREDELNPLAFPF